MSALIGALRVSLSADTAQFEAGMRRAQATASSTAGGIAKTLGTLRAGLVGLGTALGLGMFYRAVKGALEYAGSLAEVAQQLGVTTRDLQVFRFAAGQVGVSQELLETGLSKLTITLGQVAAGAKAPAKAFQAIGISVDQLKGKDTGEAFRMIADGLSKVSDRSQRAAVEVGIFKKSGAGLDNLLYGGSKAINQLATAAEKLGIVLSDDQIARADETADKLDALKTVLSAQIAGIVTDNSNAILGLANALMDLVASIQTVIHWWNQMEANFNANVFDVAGNAAAAARARGSTFVSDRYESIPGQTVTLKLPPARGPAPKPGANIGKFLAPGGSKKKSAAADHSAEDALRDANQFDQQLRRAQMDVLRATQDLATDYVERTSIGIAILDAEKAARDAEYKYQIALYALTKGKQGMSAAQAEQLRAQEDQTDQLKRQKLLQEEQTKRLEDNAKLAEGDLDRRREVLEAQAGIATTAAERRAVELELLKIAYEQKRQALQDILDNSKDDAEREAARRDLLNLNRTYGADRQGVINQTRGPLEEWAASVSKTAAEINEAFQSIEAQGLEGLSDALADVISGTKSLGEAFSDVAQSIIADLIRMSIRMLIFRALSGIFGGGASPMSGDFGGIYGGLDSTGLPSFATGGGFNIKGFGGTDRNTLSLNGLPIANVSHDERINISNDNVNGGGGVVVNQTFSPNFAGNAATREDLVQMAVMTKSATLDAIRQGNRRR